MECLDGNAFLNHPRRTGHGVCAHACVHTLREALLKSGVGQKEREGGGTAESSHLSRGKLIVSEKTTQVPHLPYLVTHGAMCFCTGLRLMVPCK